MKVALVQMTSLPDIKKNISFMTESILQAKSKSSDLVLFPENCGYMGPGKMMRSNATLEKNHPVLNMAINYAKKYSISILLGSIAVLKTKNRNIKMANRSYFIDDAGNILGKYDKIHMFDAIVSKSESYKESDSYHAGDKIVNVNSNILSAGYFIIWIHINIFYIIIIYFIFNKIIIIYIFIKNFNVNSNIGNFGLSICYDIRFPELYIKLAKRGANIITIPSAFTVDTGRAHWRVLLRSRAIETSSWVLAPAQIGNHYGKRKTWGHSMVIDPWGRVIAEADENDNIIYADIDIALSQKVRSVWS